MAPNLGWNLGGNFIMTPDLRGYVSNWLFSILENIHLRSPILPQTGSYLSSLVEFSIVSIVVTCARGFQEEKWKVNTSPVIEPWIFTHIRIFENKIKKIGPRLKIALLIKRSYEKYCTFLFYPVHSVQFSKKFPTPKIPARATPVNKSMLRFYFFNSKENMNFRENLQCNYSILISVKTVWKKKIFL